MRGTLVGGVRRPARLLRTYRRPVIRLTPIWRSRGTIRSTMRLTTGRTPARRGTTITGRSRRERRGEHRHTTATTGFRPRTVMLRKTAVSSARRTTRTTQTPVEDRISVDPQHFAGP